MLEIRFGRLLELHEILIIEKGHFEQAATALSTRGSGTFAVEGHHFRRLLDAVTEVGQMASTAALTSSAQAASRTKAFLEQATPTSIEQSFLMNVEGCGNAFRHLMDLASRIRDDCHARLYFQIGAEGAELLRTEVSHFGPDVEKAFGSAAEDIAEAAGCLALGRYTASVFHVMRALEKAAAVVAQKIGAAITDQHGIGLGWGVIANNMKVKIDKMPKGDEQTKWYRAQSFLETVNRAWRVPTAHPKQTYTGDEARRVFEATKAFMQELAPLA